MKARMVGLMMLASFAIPLVASPANTGDKKDPPPQVMQAKEQVTKHLEKINGLQSNPTIAWVEETGPEVEIIGAEPAAGRIVAVRQGPLLATAFHPELAGDVRVHRHFADMVRERT